MKLLGSTTYNVIPCMYTISALYRERESERERDLYREYFSSMKLYNEYCVIMYSQKLACCFFLLLWNTHKDKQIYRISIHRSFPHWFELDWPCAGVIFHCSLVRYATYDTYWTSVSSDVTGPSVTLNKMSWCRTLHIIIGIIGKIWFESCYWDQHCQEIIYLNYGLFLTKIKAIIWLQKPWHIECMNPLDHFNNVFLSFLSLKSVVAMNSCFMENINITIFWK